MTQPLKISYYCLPDLYQTKMRKEKEPDKAYRIVSFISRQMGIPYSDLLIKNRKREVNYCRQVCMYVLRKRTPLSYVRIASIFDRDDHTTAKNAIERIQNYMDTDLQKREQIERFLSAVY